MTEYNLMATGIGSVPFKDVEATCREIFERTPYIPFWPQFVRLSYLEDMTAQYTEGLPLLKVVEEERSIRIDSAEGHETGLVSFYERFLARDVDYFAMSREYSRGLHAMLDLLDTEFPDEVQFIKGQTVGPLTFAAGIQDENGKMVLHNQEMLEALTRGLAIKALWQVRRLGEYERRTIIFLDEPYLSGFGSAFSAIQRHEVIESLKIVIDYLRENSDALIGIHCCGNTDWPMLMEAGPDIINFDAYEYMDHLFLYPDELKNFIENKGALAWGIVPTSEAAAEETAEGLFSRLETGLERMAGLGVAPGLLHSSSMITPACGMGSMGPDLAAKVLELLSGVADLCREKI